MSCDFKEFILEVCIIRCQRLCQSRSRRLISVMIFTVAAILIFQNFSLSSKSGFSTQIPPDLQAKHEQSSLYKDLSSIKDQNLSLSQTQNLSETLNHHVTVGEMDREQQKAEKFDDTIELDMNENRDTEFSILRNGSKDDNFKENPQLVADKTGVLGNVTKNLQEEFGVNNKNLEIHPLSMSEMHSLLRKIRASYPSMRHRFSSAPEKQIMAAREKIENAPIVEADGKLYPPMYRNLSKFKRINPPAHQAPLGGYLRRLIKTKGRRGSPSGIQISRIQWILQILWKVGSGAVRFSTNMVRDQPASSPGPARRISVEVDQNKGKTWFAHGLEFNFRFVTLCI